MEGGKLLRRSPRVEGRRRARPEPHEPHRTARNAISRITFLICVFTKFFLQKVAVQAVHKVLAVQ
jgi:hypothetical protein